MGEQCECYGFLNDLQKELFEGIFPENMVPLKNPIPHRGPLGHEIHQYYLVNLARVTPEQKEKLAKVLAAKFQTPEQEVLADLQNPDHELPLRAEGLSVAFCSLHTRMMIA